MLIKPDLECGLTYVQGAHDCICGMIEVSWRIVGSHATMDVVITPDVQAGFLIPLEFCRGVL
ncbi:alpha-L-rhamnosidase C-terminal domain-containing protein [Neobacillus cucumis]|uniref:alpha-L-rhamnosidase C-terminal domain-containing protein n=1 Tax=Neobacillus cucumis TaxID=1740721 RepID=UPI001963EC36|nr:alpha-L-rhamnosidase C-terminal domain-containing protein [Neobacillus cucumis]